MKYRKYILKDSDLFLLFKLLHFILYILYCNHMKVLTFPSFGKLKFCFDLKNYLGYQDSRYSIFNFKIDIQQIRSCK